MRSISRQASGVEGNFILNDTNVLLGYNVTSTNLVPSDLTKGTTSNTCSAVIFGNFADVLIGMWNSPDVLGRSLYWVFCWHDPHFGVPRSRR
jgi:hypothetical protein